MSDGDWRDRARDLTDELDRQGVLGPGWRAAFESVPRHVFVPGFELDEVYSDTSLVTQRIDGWPTSSSTMPSLMARMLTLLELGVDDRVLEIGTGTGYNAALLCHRLGADQVTSIDIDPTLVDLARSRLAGLGQRPHLVVGDGAFGVPWAAPFTRLIATAAVGAIPTAWVEQLAPNGLAVVDVRGELSGSLIVLHRDPAGFLTGRFLGIPGRFMWLRARADRPLRDGGSVLARWAESTVVDAELDDLDDPEFAFLLEFLVPGLRRVVVDGVPMLVGPGDDADARARIVAAHRVWTEAGRPPRTLLGLTVHRDGRRELWLDEPGHPLAT